MSLKQWEINSCEQIEQWHVLYPFLNRHNLFKINRQNMIQDQGKNEKHVYCYHYSLLNALVKKLT